MALKRENLIKQTAAALLVFLLLLSTVFVGKAWAGGHFNKIQPKYVGTAMFGTAGGFWINYIGISAGSLIAYWLARHFGISLVQKMVPMEKYDSWVRRVNEKKSYMLVLFLAILLPLAPDDFLCYFSGLTSMSARKFTWIILLGKPWCILFYSLFFAYLI